MPLATSLRITFATLACAALASSAHAQAQFLPLGDLDGGVFDSAAWGVSSNGRYVVGDGAADTGAQGFRYDVLTGQLLPLEIYPITGPTTPYTFTEGRARAVSDDGVAVGWVNLYEDGLGSDPFFGGARWDDAGALTSYPEWDSSQGGGIADVTPDGSVGVGFTQWAADPKHVEYPPYLDLWEPSFWTPGGGFENGAGFGPTLFPGRGIATGVSSDGTTFSGARSALPGGEPFTAMRYSEADGVTDLGTLATGPMFLGAEDPFLLPRGGDVNSEARGISPDGELLVGWTKTGDGESAESGFEAFLWQDDGNGMIGLGDLGAGEDVASVAWAISSTSVVVGAADRGSESANRILEAFVYDPVNGMVSLEDLLTSLEIDLLGYELVAAYDISPDGNYIVGEAINPQGDSEAFLVSFVPVPEARTGSLLALGLLGWLRAGARSARG